MEEMQRAPEYLYRFRSINALLDGFNELENQEIYFATMEQLNDPMEGFKDIYWQGDEVVWKNLLKHYLYCLYMFYGAVCVAGAEHELSLNHISVFQDKEIMEIQKANGIYPRICDNFLKNPIIKSLLNDLAHKSRKIKRSELCFYLRTIHLFALGKIDEYHVKQGFPSFINGKIKKKVEQSLNVLKQFKNTISIYENTPNADEIIPTLFDSAEFVNLQQNLIADYNQLFEEKNKRLLLIDFPEAYLKQINLLLYPDYYTACFNTKYSNASMWGHYATSHKGVCLKFKVKKENSEKPALSLFLPTSISGTKEKNIISRNYVNLEFKKVCYSNKYPSINFFESLGRLSGLILNEYWYTCDGESSICAENVFKNKNDWREEYWAKNEQCLCTKLADWEYEKEYRLLISNFFWDFEKVEDRKIKYDFLDLEGVIFGINTLTEDKIKIIKIIENKCKENNRNDFKFYQANYDNKTGKIYANELTLLTLTSNKT